MHWSKDCAVELAQAPGEQLVPITFLSQPAAPFNLHFVASQASPSQATSVICSLVTAAQLLSKPRTSLSSLQCGKLSDSASELAVLLRTALLLFKLATLVSNTPAASDILPMLWHSVGLTSSRIKSHKQAWTHPVQDSTNEIHSLQILLIRHTMPLLRQCSRSDCHAEPCDNLLHAITIGADPSSQIYAVEIVKAGKPVLCAVLLMWSHRGGKHVIVQDAIMYHYIMCVWIWGTAAPGISLTSLHMRTDHLHTKHMHTKQMHTKLLHTKHLHTEQDVVPLSQHSCQIKVSCRHATGGISF